MRRAILSAFLLAAVSLAACGRAPQQRPPGLEPAAAAAAGGLPRAADGGLLVTAESPAKASSPAGSAIATPLPPLQAPTAAPSATATLPPAGTPTASAVPSPTPAPATATPSPPTATPQAVGVVSATLANVRAGPGVTHPIVGQVAAGEMLQLLARTAEGQAWYLVCCVAGSQQGWIRGDLMTLQRADAVAIAADVPTPPPAPPTAEPVSAPAAAATAQAAPLPAASYVAPPPPPPAGGPPAVNPFTGLSGGNLNRRPVFVCINNDAEARPQFGLNQADLVYEYVMEGRGITRYTALYWSQDVPRIGPVRSARLINVQMTSLYGAALLCSGASSHARYTLKHQVYFPYLDVDLDDPSNTVYSFSIGNDYRTRLQTDSGRLEKFVRAWNVNAIPSTRGLRFGDYGGGRAASRVDIPYPLASRTGWAWNGSQWARLGSAGGPYVDAATGAQLTADNVVIQWAAHEATDMVEDSLGTTGIRIVLVGSGKALVLRDGKAIDATWHADDPNQPPEFTDAGGAAIPLHPGRTWFEVVEPYYQVTIK